MARVDVLLGLQWGDEGKGKIVDLLAEKADVVVRFQGGNNAGHTIISEQGEFKFHLIPSGILREGVSCLIGNGVVLALDALVDDLDDWEDDEFEVAQGEHGSA